MASSPCPFPNLSLLAFPGLLPLVILLSFPDPELVIPILGPAHPLATQIPISIPVHLPVTQTPSSDPGQQVLLHHRVTSQGLSHTQLRITSGKTKILAAVLATQQP